MTILGGWKDERPRPAKRPTKGHPSKLSECIPGDVVELGGETVLVTAQAQVPWVRPLEGGKPGEIRPEDPDRPVVVVELRQ